MSIAPIIVCPRIKRNYLLHQIFDTPFTEPIIDEKIIGSYAENQFKSKNGYRGETTCQYQNYILKKISLYDFSSKFSTKDVCLILTNNDCLLLTVYLSFDSSYDKVRFKFFERDNTPHLILWRVSVDELFFVMINLISGGIIKSDPDLCRSHDDNYNLIYFAFNWEEIIPDPSGKIFAITGSMAKLSNLTIKFIKIEKDKVELLQTPYMSAKQSMKMKWKDNIFICGKDRIVF